MQAAHTVEPVPSTTLGGDHDRTDVQRFHLPLRNPPARRGADAHAGFIEPVRKHIRCLRVETEEQAVRTFSLEEYADAVRGSHDPVDVLWLERQFRKGGRLEGLAFKSGRKWRGTADQIDAAIERLTPKPVAVPSVPSTSGMCKTTQRRLSA
mgnify:CR=1 FL=1